MRTILFFWALFFLIFLFSLKGYSQELTPEKAFFYFLKIYGPSDGNYDNYIVNYGSLFDKINFDNSKSDEFERGKYISKVRNILITGVRGINFKDRYIVYGVGAFGEYNFDNKYFPINAWDWNISRSFPDDIGGASNGDYFYNFKNRNFINLWAFNTVINMDSEKANLFIKSRKNIEGKIDRKVYLKVSFSVIDKYTPTSNNSYSFFSYCHAIEIYSDPEMKNKISVLKPLFNYYDPIKGIKFMDTTEVVFFKSADRGHWVSDAASISKSGYLPSNVGAKYYRTIKYEDGKIIEVKDYYISGNIEMTGSYMPYCIDWHCANGKFTWYYENGLKRQEVHFVNGIMDGCVYLWDEKGKCKGTYGSIMKNNNITNYGSNSKDCPCLDQEIKLEKTKEPQPDESNVIPISDYYSEGEGSVASNDKPNIDSLSGDYSGSLYEGKKHGIGKMIYQNGNIYEGEWANDRRNGKGKQIYIDGSTYEGEWSNDSIQGKGTWIENNGKKYVGDFANGKWNGHII